MSKEQTKSKLVTLTLSQIEKSEVLAVKLTGRKNLSGLVAYWINKAKA
jgi:hypothetical protein